MRTFSFCSDFTISIISEEKKETQNETERGGTKKEGVRKKRATDTKKEGRKDRQTDLSHRD
jgi:hypothetical protein